MSKKETARTVLLRDFGYRVEGRLIIQCGIRGFTSDRIFRNCRDTFDACEQLIPIIRDDEYSSRLNRINAD